MRFGDFVLLGFFLVGFVGAGSSSTATDFNINGCNFEFEGIDIGISAGECSAGIASGYFYCESDLTHWITMDEGYGCSMGSTVYNLGEDFCCPSGMFCNQTASGKFQCDIRLENCVDQENKDDCENNGCVWMEIDEECTANPREYDCSYYDNEVDCDSDEWNLGSSGIGTEFCGSTIECAGNIFSISEDSCGCKWYPSAPEGDKCQLNMIGSEMFYDGDQDKFECSNVYSLGDCLDGLQNVSWYSSSSVIGGFPTGIPEECLNVLGCNGGEDTRFCGEPVVKLPGFSLFSLLVAFLLVGLFQLGKFK